MLLKYAICPMVVQKLCCFTEDHLKHLTFKFHSHNTEVAAKAIIISWGLSGARHDSDVVYNIIVYILHWNMVTVWGPAYILDQRKINKILTVYQDYSKIRLCI